MEHVRVTLKYDACLSVDVEGRSGGLAFLWKNKIKCSVMNFSRNFMNLMVKDEIRGQWRLTCYYGYPEECKLEIYFMKMSSVPWCIEGDFNDMSSQEDKQCIHPHPNWLCVGFQNVVGECDLTDIKLEGHPFTWI